MLPPLSAVGTVRIQLFGPYQDTSAMTKWDQANWDDAAATWANLLGWQDVTPQSLNCQISWGTDDNMGALSVCSAGSWEVATYDPQRLLDPANFNSPWYRVLEPGGLVRIAYTDGVLNDETVRVGFIDEIEYDIAEKIGSIRASDGISLMVKAKLPEGMAHEQATPVSLRAFARYVIKKARIDYITVEADPPAPDYDPAIGLAINSEASVWQQITAAALDAMHAVWLDREGVLRFRYFGKARDRNFIIGTGGVPMDDLTTRLSMEGVFNHAIARYMSFNEQWSEVQKAESVAIYGDLILRRDRPNPNSGEWVDQMLQDRGASAVQYDIGTIRPVTRDQFATIISLGMVDQVELHVHGHGNPIDRSVVVLGGTVEANTESGWSAKLATYEPASPWWNQDDTRVYQRKYMATLSVETSNFTGAWVGDGGTHVEQEVYFRSADTEPELQMGRKYILMKLAPIDFSDMANIYEAKLRFYLPPHEETDANGRRLDHIELLGVGAIQQDWDSSANGDGLVTGPEVWGTPDPIGGWFEFTVTDIVNAWMNGDGQYGVKVDRFYDTSTPSGIYHAIMSGARATTKPYLLIGFRRPV